MSGTKAFPGPGYKSDKGMDPRDWFAGQALAGVASAVNVHDYPDQIPRVAKTAYLLADAMMEARAK